ncbi:MAG: branched-chain amino acid ABC transporter substrate-binding protein [Hyphomicrobiales bacterium]
MADYIKTLLGAVLMVALSAGTVRAEIVIAIVGPITGPDAVLGEQMQRGAEMAVKRINQAGGVLGEQLVLQVGDDTCEVEDAVAIANQMLNSQAVFVVGHLCSSTSIAASKIYHKGGILQISPGSTNPELTDQGLENVFRVCGRDDKQGPTAADYVIDGKLGSKVAVIHDKTTYGQGLADQFKKHLNNKGVSEVLYEAIEKGEKDFGSLVKKMKSSGVDLMYYGGAHLEAGLITRQSRKLGLNAKMMSGDGLSTREFWDITGEAGEGTLFTFEADPRKFGAANEAVRAFREIGYEPEGYTLFTYAAVQVFAQAAERAGSTKIDALVKAMKAVEFNTMKSHAFSTVMGKLAFDDKGDPVGAGYRLYRFSKGDYQMIGN